jgi:hypothetical protein
LNVPVHTATFSRNDIVQQGAAANRQNTTRLAELSVRLITDNTA